MFSAIDSGSASVIFTSPEATQNTKFTAAVRCYRERVCLVAFDEAHCLSEWGDNFRPDYKKAVNLRSLVTKAPCLALTATMTPRVYEDVLSGLQVGDDNVAVKAYPPDRPNVFIDVARRSCLSPETDLAWLADMLESQQQQCPKTVVFARTINAVTELYGWLLSRLQCKAFAGDNCVAATRMVSMFHGHISAELQLHILDDFRQPDSVTRVVVATVAFGIGVEIRDIRNVIHWGKV